MIALHRLLLGLLVVSCPVIARISLETTFEVTNIDPSLERKITTVATVDDQHPTVIYSSDDLQIEVEVLSTDSKNSENLAFVTYTISHKNEAGEWKIIENPSLVAALGKKATSKKSTTTSDGTLIESRILTLLATKTS